jgi:hypothetical protein
MDNGASGKEEIFTLKVDNKIGKERSHKNIPETLVLQTTERDANRSVYVRVRYVDRFHCMLTRMHVRWRERGQHSGALWIHQVSIPLITSLFRAGRTQSDL